MKLLKLLLEHIYIYICVQCCSSKMFKVIMFVHVRFSGCYSIGSKSEARRCKASHVGDAPFFVRSQIWLDWNHPSSDIVVPHFCARNLHFCSPVCCFFLYVSRTFHGDHDIISWTNSSPRRDLHGEITSTFGVPGIEWSFVGRGFPPKKSRMCVWTNRELAGGLTCVQLQIVILMFIPIQFTKTRGMRCWFDVTFKCYSQSFMPNTTHNQFTKWGPRLR